MSSYYSHFILHFFNFNLQTKTFPRLQCFSLWFAGILFFRIVHMADWHCESRSDTFHEEDVDGCLENCYTWRQNAEPVCLSDECSALLPHIKKVNELTKQFGFQTKVKKTYGDL